MRATINGTRYDAANATLIGGARSAAPETSHEWWIAGLFKTPRAGRYFLAGEGEIMTRWGLGNSGIDPIEPDFARDWAERYLTAAQVEAEFGSRG